jgi:hypothetical protein
VALDFLENLKMGERVIQEIKNKKKEKDMKGKKIEITVPDGYDFVQEGNSCCFIEKNLCY